METCNSDKQSFRYLYDLNTSIEEKIGIVSKEIYGADGIELSEEAQKKVTLYNKQVIFIRVWLKVSGFRKAASLHRKDAVFVFHGCERQGCADWLQDSNSGS